MWSKVQALIQQELERHGIQVEAITDAQAKHYYEQHPELFNQVMIVHLAAIVVQDAQLAEQLLQQADGSSNAKFAQLVAQYSVDEASKARDGHLMVIDERVEHTPGNNPHADPGEQVFTPVAMSLRRVGQTGLTQGPDGRYYVLRATKLEMSRRPWSEELQQRVKNIMFWERREHVLSTIEQQLRKDAQVTINNEVLNQIPASSEQTATNKTLTAP